MKKFKLNPIQIVLTLLVLTIGGYTYYSLPSSHALKNATPVLQSNTDGCPKYSPRSCCEDEYCQKKGVCSLTPKECNGQDDRSACIVTRWRNIKESKFTLCDQCHNPESIVRQVVKCN